MKILLSPAKRLNTSPEKEWPISTTPQFLNESQKLMNELKNYSPRRLKNLMNISNEIAELNVERNHEWKAHPTEKESIQAGLMFDGEVYRGLHNHSLTKDQVQYLSQNMFILSGLYGMLRLTDRVMPYRLEMGSKLKVGKAKNLHQFWRETLTEYFNGILDNGEPILDLASKEYTDALDIKSLKGKFLNVKFLDYRNDKFKPITVFFKQARGQMAQYCAENQIKTTEDLKAFDRMNYSFNDQLSDDETFIFTR